MVQPTRPPLPVLGRRPFGETSGSGRLTVGGRSFDFSELHEYVEPALLDLFRQRFGSTHHFEIIPMSGRNPDAVPPMRHVLDVTKWSLISEGRPEDMR